MMKVIEVAILYLIQISSVYGASEFFLARNERITYKDAKIACAKLNADLAHITAENLKNVTALFSETHQHAWIGSVEGGHSRKKCLQLDKNGLISPIPICGAIKHVALCERVIKEVKKPVILVEEAAVKDLLEANRCKPRTRTPNCRRHHREIRYVPVFVQSPNAQNIQNVQNDNNGPNDPVAIESNQQDGEGLDLGMPVAELITETETETVTETVTSDHYITYSITDSPATSVPQIDASLDQQTPSIEQVELAPLPDALTLTVTLTESTTQTESMFSTLPGDVITSTETETKTVISTETITSNQTLTETQTSTKTEIEIQVQRETLTETSTSISISTLTEQTTESKTITLPGETITSTETESASTTTETSMTTSTERITESKTIVLTSTELSTTTVTESITTIENSTSQVIYLQTQSVNTIVTDVDYFCSNPAISNLSMLLKPQDIYSGYQSCLSAGLRPVTVTDLNNKAVKDTARYCLGFDGKFSVAGSPNDPYTNLASWAHETLMYLTIDATDSVNRFFVMCEPDVSPTGTKSFDLKQYMREMNESYRSKSK